MIDEKSRDIAEKLVKKFLDKLGYEGEISSEILDEVDGSYIKIDVKGEELSDLIGYHGKNLDSMQHLINLSFNKGKEEFDRVVLDINAYRESREEYLRSLAGQALISVKETGQLMTLPPMRASERRVIHITLKSEDGVSTTSEGEEPDRYVVVKPD